MSLKIRLHQVHHVKLLKSPKAGLKNRLLLCAALPLLLIGQPASAQDTRSLIEQARAAAQSNQNREAADLFRRAIDGNPDLRAEVLREYADQLTYSDRAGEAVPLYREVLSAPALASEERRRAMQGLALALGWSGQHEQAARTYGEILAADPSDRQALIGRGRVQTWRSRYREAEADFKAALAGDPNNAEAIRGLAEAQSLQGHHRDAIATLRPITGQSADAASLYLLARTESWLGRQDLSEGTVGRLLAAQPDHAEARKLQREVDIARAPLTETSVRHSEQSDQSDFTQISAWQSFFPSGALSMAGVGYDLYLFRPEGGTDIDVHRPAIQGRLRYSPWGEINGQVGLNIEREPGETDHILTYTLYTTLTPSDRLRFDAGVSRNTFDNIRSMLLDVTATNYGLSTDIGSDAGLKGSLRGSISDFSDGNERYWGQAELRQRLLWRPNLFAGLRYTSFRFSQLLDNGYFNPRSLQALEATTQLWGRIGDTFYDLRGAVGREDSDPGGSRTIYNLEARLTQLLTQRLQLEAYLNSFSSRLNTPGGFSRTTGGLTARVRW
jgi:tetratricopeptide (TPR) repeat protein